MKIRLIHPTVLDDNGNAIRYKRLNMLSLTLPTIAALTPQDVEVDLKYEAVDPVNFDEKVDLVGITALTNNVARAYQIGDEYRKRGVKVVMGGIHASALPEEALQHVDSVVIGEAEDIWPDLVRNFQKTGTLERIYRNAVLPDLQKLLIPRYDLINPDYFIKPMFNDMPIFCVYTSRGCPFNCDFCSVTRFFGNKYRTKPIENVVKEIEHWSAKCKNVYFVDDNILGKAEYAEELFKALIPLNITWSSEFDSTAVNKPKLIELAGKSGCRSMLIGFETLNPDNLKSVNKTFNKIDKYKDLIKMLKDNGIAPEATMMVGLDNDDTSIIERTIDFLLENGIIFFRISILTPYPGTKIYQKLNDEGRILVRDWSKYDVTHTVFQPAKMTPEELTESIWKIYNKTYSYAGICKRFWKLKDLFFGKYRKRHSLFFELTYQYYIRKSIMKRLDPISDEPL